MKQLAFLLLCIFLLQACAPSSSDNNSQISMGDLNLKIEGEDFMLSSKGEEEAYLLSTDTYENFSLTAEFLPSASGSIVFRMGESESPPSTEDGYRVKLDLNPDPQNPIGSIVEKARAHIFDSLDVSHWQKIKIEAFGDRLQVWINDKLASQTHDKTFAKGKIALLAAKSSSEQVGYRNIKVEALGMSPEEGDLLEDEYRSASQEFVNLFPTDDFGTWDQIGEGNWEIQDGVIHGYSGEKGSFLVSKESYKNFYFKTSFKIKYEDNSGIFIRKSPDRADVSIEDAIECNIYDHNGPTHPYSTGSIVNNARAWFQMIDYEDWNELEIFAKEDHIVMFINGRKSADAHVPSSFVKAGNICLQAGFKVFAPDKGPSDIYFKDLMIKNMDAS